MQALAVSGLYFLRLSCSETLTSLIHRRRSHFKEKESVTLQNNRPLYSALIQSVIMGEAQESPAAPPAPGKATQKNRRGFVQPLPSELSA